MGKKSTVTLTAELIRKSKVPDGSQRIIIFDKNVTGFGVIKYRSGRVSFFIDKVVEQDKKVRRTICTFPKIWVNKYSVREIRNKAIMISDLVDEMSVVKG